MTDKVQKIRKEVERLFNHVKDSSFESDSGAFYYLKDLLDFIDSLSEESDLNWKEMSLQEKKDLIASLQKDVEEPVGEEWIEELRTKLDSMSKEDFKKAFDKYAIDFNRESVNKDLDKAVVEYMIQFSGENYYNSPWVMDSTGMAMPKELARFGAKWQKEQMMAKAIDAELYSDGMFVPLIGIKDKEKVSNIKFGDKVKVIIIKED